MRNCSCPLEAASTINPQTAHTSMDFCCLQGSHCAQAPAQQQPPARGCQRHPTGLAPAAQARQAPPAHPEAPPGAGHGLQAPAAEAGQVGHPQCSCCLLGCVMMGSGARHGLDAPSAGAGQVGQPQCRCLHVCMYLPSESRSAVDARRQPSCPKAEAGQVW